MYALKSGIFRVASLACAIMLVASGLQAQVLLIDPSTSLGTTTIPTADVPYSVPTTSQWNRGNSGTYGNSGALFYSNGTAATGVTAITDALDNVIGPAAYNFTAPSTGNAGNSGISGVFASNPVNNGVFGNTATNVSYGGIAMKIGGLSFGTYDIYLVTAYVGVTSGSWAGGASPAQHNVWAFSGANLTGFNTGTFGAPNQLLENSTRTSWVENNNYAKLTVTLDATNPFLYLVSEGAVNDSRRGWMDAVQIVSIPEPSAYALLGLGAGAMMFLRRRKQRAWS